MPPRVAYWCSSFEPGMEANAKEIAILREVVSDSAVWGISNKHVLQWSKRDGYAFHPRLQFLFRLMTGRWQGKYDVNHLFGSLGDWHHLRALNKRPTVMTVSLANEPCDRALLKKVDRFIVEWPDAANDLKARGVDGAAIDLVYPPADLETFIPSPAPELPFTILFASSPDLAEWLEARGVDVLLGAAKLRPDMRFHFVWRPWGDALPKLRQMIDELEIKNVHVDVGRIADMRIPYQQSHVTVFCAKDRHRCKPAPNSIVESMASGRPVVVTSTIGLSPLIDETGAGIVVEQTSESLARALDELQNDWIDYSGRARQAAELHFDQKGFIRRYLGIYDELCRRS